MCDYRGITTKPIVSSSLGNPEWPTRTGFVKRGRSSCIVYLKRLGYCGCKVYNRYRDNIILVVDKQTTSLFPLNISSRSICNNRGHSTHPTHSVYLLHSEIDIRCPSITVWSPAFVSSIPSMSGGWPFNDITFYHHRPPTLYLPPL